MADLSSQQINQSYPGLLTLANSTTGITNTTQSVQDGLGNDTGLQISENYLGGSSLFPAYRETLAKYYGSSHSGNFGSPFEATSVDLLNSVAFYDKGDVVYSAITINVMTESTTGDEMTFGIYDYQQLNPYGIQPKNIIVSGLTLTATDLSTTGAKTIIFPTPTSLGKGGAKFLCYVITNSGSTSPSMNISEPFYIQEQVSSLGTMYGWAADYGFGLTYQNPFAGQYYTPTLCQVYTGQTGNLLATYGTDIGSKGSSFTSTSIGFLLHTSI